MKLNKASLLLSALLCSLSVVALESDYEQPINVSSVSQHAKMKTNTIVFTGDVLLTQGTIKVTGDVLTVIRGKISNSEIMIAKGEVATFYQTQDDGKPLNAEANNIRYDVANAKITLTGNAQVKQLDSQINGSKITYFLNTEELIVESDENNEQRVKTIFLPAQFDQKKENSVKEKTEEK